MNNDYVPLGWTETEYKTSANYNPHGLNDDKADHIVKSNQMKVRIDQEQELDFGEAYIYDYRLANNEVIYGD
jgi:hypothetical protein